MKLPSSSLFTQALLTFTLILGLSLAAAVATRQQFVAPKVAELQQVVDQRDLRRALLALEGELAQLAVITYNNAVWDPLWGHLQAAQPTLIDDTFPPEILEALDIDVLAIFDRQARLIDRRQLPDRPAPSAATLVPVLIPLSGAASSAPQLKSGILQTDQGVMLYAVATIMRNRGSSQPAGNLLLGRLMDDDLAADLAANSQLDLQLRPITADLGPIVSDIESVRRDANNQLRWRLHDVTDQPVLELSIQLSPTPLDARLGTAPLLAALTTCLLGLALALGLTRRTFIQPIQNIERHLHWLRDTGDYSARLPSSARQDEIGRLSREIDHLADHIARHRVRMAQQAEQLAALSLEDSLTGLGNRRRFDQMLTRQWALAQRQQRPLALLMMDVDYFKPYNDHYGHLQGDRVLQQLAIIMRSVLTRQSDVAARYGGEEFAILLADTDEAGARRLADRLQAALRAANIEHNFSTVSQRLTATIGLAAIVPDPHQEARDLINRADEALYAAKAAGRDRVMSASRLDALIS